MSEEQQLEATDVEEGEIVTDVPEMGPMDVDQALLLYKNLQLSLNHEIDSMLSPFVYDKQGKRTKSKNQSRRLTDLMTMATVLKRVLVDLEPNPEQFETEKGKHLYGSMFAVMKAKEVIKADLKSKILSGDVPNNVSQELKDKLLKEL